MESQEEVTTCSDCDRAIQMGQDLWTAEKAVLGPRGVVPLDEVLYFCSQKCISVFFEPDDEVDGVLGPRIP